MKYIPAFSPFEWKSTRSTQTRSNPVHTSLLFDYKVSRKLVPVTYTVASQPVRYDFHLGNPFYLKNKKIINKRVVLIIIKWVQTKNIYGCTYFMMEAEKRWIHSLKWMNEWTNKHVRFPLDGRVIAVTSPKSPTLMEPSKEKKILAG